jgi:hypothetical protein
MCDVLPYIAGWTIGIGTFLVFHRSIIKALEKIVSKIKDDE